MLLPPFVYRHYGWFTFNNILIIKCWKSTVKELQTFAQLLLKTPIESNSGTSLNINYACKKLLDVFIWLQLETFGMKLIRENLTPKKLFLAKKTPQLSIFGSLIGEKTREKLEKQFWKHKREQREANQLCCAKFHTSVQCAYFRLRAAIAK